MRVYAVFFLKDFDQHDCVTITQLMSNFFSVK